MENQTAVAVATPQAIIQKLNETKPMLIPELDFVREKFMNNYMLTHGITRGQAEMYYYSQLAHMKMLIANNKDLQVADSFSLYACITTCAVNGYDLDPSAHEVYLLALKGKAVLWPQPPAKVKRLKRTGQIKRLDQPKLVYKGDIFEVENGRVVKHIEKFESEIFTVGYVRVTINEKGDDIYFIYRQSDWESWKKKSIMASGENWTNANGLPHPGFLRTKIVSHACGEKCWSSGKNLVPTEEFNVEVDLDALPGTTSQNLNPPAQNSIAAPAASATQNETPSPTAQAAISAMKNNTDEAASFTVKSDDDVY